MKKETAIGAKIIESPSFFLITRVSHIFCPHMLKVGTFLFVKTQWKKPDFSSQISSGEKSFKMWHRVTLVSGYQYVMPNSLQVIFLHKC